MSNESLEYLAQDLYSVYRYELDKSPNQKPYGLSIRWQDITEQEREAWFKTAQLFDERIENLKRSNGWVESK